MGRNIARPTSWLCPKDTVNNYGHAPMLWAPAGCSSPRNPPSGLVGTCLPSRSRWGLSAQRGQLLACGHRAVRTSCAPGAPLSCTASHVTHPLSARPRSEPFMRVEESFVIHSHLVFIIYTLIHKYYEILVKNILYIVGAQEMIVWCVCACEHTLVCVCHRPRV